MDSEKLQDSLSRSSKRHIYSIDDSLCDVSAIIPITAIPLKVTNVHNPYIMRAYEINNYSEKLDRIDRKLLSFVRKNNSLLKRRSYTQKPKIGDMVLIQSSNQKYMIELPSFICRGLITHCEKGAYSVLFVDHGVNFELSQDQFCTIPHDFISDSFLTKVVGVCNVMPVCLRRDTVLDGKSMIHFTETKWSDGAIQFARDLLIASRAVYFDRLFTDETNGREYGELYLVIDDIIVSLNEALIVDYHATHFTKDLLGQMTYTKGIRKDVVVFVKFSIDKSKRNCTILNRCSDLKKLCLSEKILIYGTESSGVLNNVTDLGFPPAIHQAWEKYISKCSRPRKLQSYVWPAVQKGLNVVAIGASQCGKTSACVMAICGLVATRQKEMPRCSTRPLALILCSSSSEVINVHSSCMSLLDTCENTKSVAAFNGKTDRSVAAAIYSGCQILVTTPRYLTRFLKENPNLLSFDRLLYLVFDNADVILDKYYDSVGELFKKHDIIENREPQVDGRPLLQIIITATYWTLPIKKFTRLVMYNPYICIASFIEGVVFKSVHPKIYILMSAWKNRKIADILKDDYKIWKTMVVCTNAEEAEELNALLSPTKKTLLIHERMKSLNIQNLEETWKACVFGLYPILVCTDAVLSELSFTDIQWLIHHSVELKFKNQFNYRFSVLLDDLLQDKTNCKVSIIIDENNNVQFQSIVKMMARMKVVIPSQLQQNIERMAVTLENDKKEYAICDNVKAFGFCQERNVCTFRHCVLPAIDEPTMAIQMNDRVKLMPMYIHDVSHLSARVIEHIPHSDEFEKVTFSRVEYMQTTAKLQEYYKNIENRKVCSSTDVGDVCILQEPVDTFKRVEIRCIKYNRGRSEEVKFVDVRCIDTGIIHEHIDVRKLIHLPEELSKLPTHTVEVFLTDVAPYDEEYIWNRHSNNAVLEWFTQNFDQRSYIIGKVRLHLGNTIWLDDVEIGTKLIGRDDLVYCSLKKHIVSKNHAIASKDHMSRLFDLCKSSGLTEVYGIK